MSGQQTLLQLTQNVLSGLSSDEVNSISDTVESMQVATIIKNKYYDILSRTGYPKLEQAFQLTAPADASTPTLMTIPANIKNLQWLKYFDSNVLDGTNPSDFEHDLNTDIVSVPAWSTTSSTSVAVQTGIATFTVSAGLTASAGDGFIATAGTNYLEGTVTSYIGTALVVNATTAVGSGAHTSWTIAQSNGITAPPGYLYVTVLPFQQFMDMVNQFNPVESNVSSFTFSDNSNNFNNDFTFYYKNNRQPQYCTVLSNHYVIFDSYDNSQDSTLQEDKTMAYGEVIPAFTMSDTFTPNLDVELFQLLLNEAKALAYFELKQMMHPKAEQEAKRQWSSMQRNKSVAHKPTDFEQLPGFGRFSGKTYR